ncbi:protein-tyrosine-phosphatase [soil metagenome]
MHLLFVCTGNICRSPTAERLTQAYAAQLPDPGQLTASSAGTRAVYGSRMEPNAELVLDSLGGSGRGFLARQISPEIVADADIVLAMTEQHRTTVLHNSPRHLARTFTLLEAITLAEAVAPQALSDPADLGVRGRELALAMVRQRAMRHAAEPLSDDILDPIGGDPILFAQVGEQIAGALTAWLDILTGRR